MAVTVEPLAADQWRDAGAMLARAFDADPQFRALFPNDADRPAILQPFFAMALIGALHTDQMVETTPSLSAAAVWSPPGHRSGPTVSSSLRATPQMLRWLRAASPRSVRQAMAWGSRCEQRRKRLMTDPHWHLVMLGVEPARQRLGLGAALVHHGLARADADRLPSFVQTEDARNAAFYGKLGFETVEYVSPQDEPLGVPVWLMTRQSRDR
jgi:ribosomal protein S18 acetylase RimI-like enzyme